MLHAGGGVREEGCKSGSVEGGVAVEKGVPSASHAHAGQGHTDHHQCMGHRMDPSCHRVGGVAVEAQRDRSRGGAWHPWAAHGPFHTRRHMQGASALGKEAQATYCVAYAQVANACPLHVGGGGCHRGPPAQGQRGIRLSPSWAAPRNPWTSCCKAHVWAQGEGGCVRGRYHGSCLWARLPPPACGPQRVADCHAGGSSCARARALAAH